MLCAQTPLARKPNNMCSLHPPALDAQQLRRPQYQILPALTEEDFAALRPYQDDRLAALSRSWPILATHYGLGAFP